MLLLDEIDKADPDVPNDLLEPFDRETFLVRETGETISATRPTLLVLTTNGERELPPAFLRRCVTLRLDPPTEDWFTDIADRRYGPADNGLHRDVAREVMRLRGLGRAAGVREPGTGEYLDALDVCRELKIDTRSGVWSDVVRSVLWKHDRPPEPAEQPEQPEEGVAAPARREAV